MIPPGSLSLVVSYACLRKDGILTLDDITRFLNKGLLAFCLLLLFCGCATEKAATILQPAISGPAVSYTSASTLEELYGIRITLIGVTGGGGLIDLRFKVIDRGKASLIVSPSKLPELIAVDSGYRLTATKKMAGNVIMKSDAVSFLLYPNVRSAIKPGTLVSVVFGDVRTEPIVAQ